MRRFIRTSTEPVIRSSSRIVPLAAQGAALLLTAFAFFFLRVPLAADTIAKATPPPPPSELVQYRTVSSRTFDNHDGTYTTSAYSGPIHYRDEQGRFQPISSALVASGEAGYAYENEANSFRALFRQQAGADFLALESWGGRRFRLRLQGAAQSTAQARPRGINYPDVFAGVDLRYELQPDGVKETLLLANAQVPTSYRFLLSAPEGARIHAVQQSGGSWALYMAPHARPALVLEAPWLSERGDPAPAAPHASLDVTRVGQDFQLDLSLDAAWLSDPQRQFPVRVDPTLTIQPPTQDASFDFACSTCAGVASDRLPIGKSNISPSPIWRSALQFSLADIPAGASVSSATLKLYFDGTCVPIVGSTCGGTSHQVDALKMTSSWSKNSKTSQLVFNSTPLASFTLPSGAAAQWMNWNITSTVQGWVSSTIPNFGLLLKRATEPTASSGPKPPSRGYAPEPTLGPKLEVTYNGNGGELLEPETVHSNGAELSWIPYSGPGAPPFDRYEVHRSATPNFTPSDSTRLTTIMDSSVTSYRDTTAKAGATFTYKVVVNGVETNAQTVAMPATGQARKLLRPDPAAGLDTYIGQRSDSTDCVNRGAYERLKLGTDAISIWRPLLRFKLSDISPDATITAATLSLWHPETTTTALTALAYRVTSNWQEGTGITTCTGDGATWYEADGGVRWAQDGGDLAATSTASLAIPTGSQPAWSQWSLTSLVQQWVAGTYPNDGLLLKLNDETRVAGKSIDFYASDFGVAPTLRPKLSVTYTETAPAPAPTVALSKPVAGALVKGTAVGLEAAAFDDGRVDSVAFLVDGNLIATDTGAPFSVAWNSTAVGNGSHTLTARATDEAGNQTTSSGVAVSVGNSAPPTTSITSPTGGSVSGTVAVSANASDDVGVTKVEFYVDSVLLATDTSSPYSASWNTLDPAFPAYDGGHTLTTTAYDAHQQVTTSAPVSVTAANAAGTQFLADFSSSEIPFKMTYQPGAPSQQLTAVDVTVTNRSLTTWSATDIVLRYRWFQLGSSTAIFDSASTSLGTAVLPGGQVTRQLLVAPPDLPAGVARATYRLRFDLYDQASSSWFAAHGNKPLEVVLPVEQLNHAHPQPPPPMPPLSGPEELGIEPMFQYDREALGLGMENLVNVATGNSVVRWVPMKAPGQGLGTAVQLTYNSFEGKCNANFCPIGSGWSLSISSLTRFGQQALKVKGNRADLVDADGTDHVFDWDNQANKWIPRPGTHLYLREDGANPPGYLVTTPSRVTYAYDCGGNPTSVRDKNGNQLTFELDSPPNGCSSQRVVNVKDAANNPNRVFHVEYYAGTPENKRVKSITDHSGHRLEFCYDGQGGDHPNLLQIIEHGAADVSTCEAPAAASRSFVFTYETDDSQQLRQMLTVRDPLGHDTTFGYVGTADQKDKLESRKDREYPVTGQLTSFGYTTQDDPGTNVTTVTAPPTSAPRVTVYTDGHNAGSTLGNQDQGLIDSILDPEQRTTSINWTDADHPSQPLRHVWKVTEPGTGSRTTEFTYNARGLVTDKYDPMGHHAHFDYLEVAGDGGFTSDLTGFTDPNGNPWTFLYDPNNINLVKIIDPDGSPFDPFMTFTYYSGPPGFPGALQSTADGNGNGPTVEAYDENGLPTRIRDAKQGVTQASYDANGLVQWVQDPLHYGNTFTGDGRDVRTVFDYDRFYRLVQVTSPKSTKYERGRIIWRSRDYDLNDNVLISRQPSFSPQPASPGAGATIMTYNNMDRLLTTTNPEGHKTAFTYDAAGRVATVRRPKGFVNPPPPAQSYTTEYRYDRLDRVLSQIQYAEDGVASRRTHYCYDTVGDLRWLTAPNAARDNAPSPCESDTDVPRFTTRYAYDHAHRRTSITEPLNTAPPNNDTRMRSFGYDDNGNTTSVTNELGTDTTYTYTRRNELETTTQIYTSSPLHEVKSVLVYDRAGNVIRSVSPRAWDAAGQHDPGPGGDYVTEYLYDQLNRLVRTALPKKAGGNARTYVHHGYDANGNVTWTTLPVQNQTLSDPPSPGQIPDSQWTLQSYLDPGWIYASNDHVNPIVHFDYRAEGWQARRLACGSLGCDDRTWAYTPDGLVSNIEEHSWRGNGSATYSYDEDKNLKQAVERRGILAPGQTAYTIINDYNGYDEPTQTKQKQETDTDFRYTNYRYDLNGNVDRRWDDGASAQGGRLHQFSYDEADQLTDDYDQGADKQPNTPDDQDTVYHYLLTGWDSQKIVKRRDTGNWPTEAQTDSTYFANGDLKTLVTTNKNNAVVENHTLDYLDNGVYMNGNRVSDLFRLKTPTDGTPTPCDSADCRAVYSYDARDSLTQEQDYRPNPTLDRTLTWEYDDALNVKTETVAGVVRRFVYAGTRLNEEQDSSYHTQYRYFYDPVGNLNCVTSGAPSTGSDCPDPVGAQVPANLVERYTWDYLDRLQSFRRYGTSAVKTDYEVDPLNRVAKETETRGGTPRRTCFSYIGLTAAVSAERRVGADCGGTATSTKSYSFDADLERTSMNVQGMGPGDDGDYFFTRNVHGDPSLLLRATDGSSKASYGYLPYGAPDSELTREPNHTADDPFNPYRFNDRRLDSGSGSEDMGARRFSTAFGGGRYLQLDSMLGAGEDSGLSLDLANMNRYAFGPGNPLSYVETDGHAVAAGDGGKAAATRRAPIPPVCAPLTAAACRTSRPALLQQYWAKQAALAQRPKAEPAGPTVGIDQPSEEEVQAAYWQECCAAEFQKAAGPPSGGVLASALETAGNLTIPNIRKGARGESYSLPWAIVEAGSFWFKGPETVGVGGVRAAEALGKGGDLAGSAAVHGNSRLSQKTTFLYRLSDDEGNYLKTGITSNPSGRYSQKFLLDKRLEFLTSGSRSDMMNLERFIVERDQGPLNFEPWAGDFAGDVP